MKRQFRELNADTKQRISQALKGRGLTDNHKQAISDGMRAYWATTPTASTICNALAHCVGD